MNLVETEGGKVIHRIGGHAADLIVGQHGDLLLSVTGYSVSVWDGRADAASGR